MYIDTTVLNNHVKTPLNLPYDFILRKVYYYISAIQHIKDENSHKYSIRI